jgi:sugar O-acyltransferase (sialic acid O-acetyltransferase NeuD family)
MVHWLDEWQLPILCLFYHPIIELIDNCHPAAKRHFEIAGFLDDNLSALDNVYSDFKILGRIFEYPLQKDDFAIISIIDTEIKRNIYSQLKDKVNFFSYIDSTSFVGKFTDIGEGSIICPQCLISTNVKIGKFVFLNSATQIGHNSVVNDFSSVMSNVNIGGECTIGNSVFFGTGSIVIPGKTICSNSIIGAGAVVIRDIKTPATYFGNPALKL